MVRLVTPECDFGEKAKPFLLKNIDGTLYSLEMCKGPNGLLVMFICNHCPYVKAIRDRLVSDTKRLLQNGIGVAAIMSNDTESYPEDNFENMMKASKEYGFPFVYLLDETQAVAKAYGAVCTPDFFGFNANLELQYRGRLDESGRNPAPPDAKRELVEAMLQIAKTGKGPTDQTPSQGCSIKWKE